MTIRGIFAVGKASMKLTVLLGLSVVLVADWGQARTITLEAPISGQILVKDISFQRQTGDGYRGGESSTEGQITGVIVNNSSHAIVGGQFNLTMIDKKGKKISCILCTTISFYELPSGQSLPLSFHIIDKPEVINALVRGAVDRLTLNYLRYSPEYKFSLPEPDSQPGERLAVVSAGNAVGVEDKALRIAVKVSTDRLMFDLANKSESPIMIEWDRASFVDASGKAHRVIHNGIKFAEKEKFQPPTVVPPGTSVSDAAIPSDNVRFVEILGEWTTGVLVPGLVNPLEDAEVRSVKALEGRTLTLFLSLDIGGQHKNYTLSIRIDSVEI